IRSGFDDPKILHHVKAIVADKEYVIMGSHNWTKSSTSFNKETSIYLESKELGREIAQYLKTIEIVPDTVGRPSHTSQKKTKWEKRDLLVKVTNTETGKTLQRADITVRTRKRRNRFETKKRTGFGRNSGKALFKKLITNREYEIIYDKKILKRFKITSDTGTRMIVQINVPPT
ncbi:MAG: hypothetical protein JKX97_08820, partial [Candidatus Lindowbacteria bacterium]|nr:hypothetical protein [Candidatus Lindowbacteria bacterium]